MWQVPPGAIVVESVSDHEQVGNVEADEVGLDRHLRAALLPQEHERPHASRPPAPQVSENRVQCPATVEDVIHEEHVLPREIWQQIKPQVEPPRPRRRAAIAAGPDHRESHRAVEPANQVRDDHDAAGEHADDREWAVTIGLSHVAGQTVDPLGKLFGGEQGLHTAR